MLAAGRGGTNEKKCEKWGRKLCFNPLASLFGISPRPDQPEAGHKTGKVVRFRFVCVRWFLRAAFTHRGGFKEVGVLGLAGLLKPSGDPQLSLLD